MRIFVLADDGQWNHLVALSDATDWQRTSRFEELLASDSPDAIFNLQPDAWQKNYDDVTVPVFINSVSDTLGKGSHAGHVVRINAWPGFIQRKIWELAGTLTDAHIQILHSIGQPYQVSPDEPGMVSARILSMIINEAYFAKEQGVSSSMEIDEAMKLGTNYPKGPFEWAHEIGLTQVLHLLTTLALTDTRYQPSSLLEKEALSS